MGKTVTHIAVWVKSRVIESYCGGCILPAWLIDMNALVYYLRIQKRETVIVGLWESVSGGA